MANLLGATECVTATVDAANRPVRQKRNSSLPFTIAPGAHVHGGRAAIGGHLFNSGAGSIINQGMISADVLRPGSTYGVEGRTVAQAGQDVTTQPLRARASASFADAILGPFTP